MPGCLYACALRHAGTPSPWHPKVPSVPSVPFHKLARQKKGCGYRLQTLMRKTSSCTLKTISNKKRKNKIPCCCVPGLWGPEIRFCGCVKCSQNIWRRIRQAPLHSCLHPAKTYPPFPCSIDVHTHTKDLQKNTHTHIYI